MSSSENGKDYQPFLSGPCAKSHALSEGAYKATKRYGFCQSTCGVWNGGVELIEYIPYSIRNIKSLQIVYNDTIEYEYKSTDRSTLNKLVADKGACDEIIIVKNGYITDASFTNLAIFDSGEWITPKRPLLYGTKRASLLDKRLIKEADITLDVLRKACKVRLFNAMIEFGEIEIDVKHITM